MKKKLLLSCLLIAILTPYSKALSTRIDSTIYPLISYSEDGQKLITITEWQEKKATKKLLELKKCRRENSLKINLIDKLNLQLSDYQKSESKSDSLLLNKSLIIEAQEDKIKNLEKQMQAQKDINVLLEKERKKSKRKITGWKIGTFVVIGVFAIALPTTIAILAK